MTVCPSRKNVVEIPNLPSIVPVYGIKILIFCASLSLATYQLPCRTSAVANNPISHLSSLNESPSACLFEVLLLQFLAMPSWYDLAVDKRQRQSETIPSQWRIQLPPESALNVISSPETCGLLTPEEIEITNVSVEILLLKLAAGEWSSFVVTTAFYKRAVISHQLVNCLTEIFVERALARATELDEYMKKTGKVAGPLHGLPISLKDQLCIKGLETTMGYVSWIGKYAESNAVLVDILYECGAVPFVRTNVPQTLMWGETFNNIFGRTSNPHNRSLTSGGSSGGEGALVALKGSPLGVGSDIGGSIRDPAALCGVYGLRPSYGRIPYGGAVNSMEGQDSMPSVLGPLSGSVGGLKIFMEAVINAEPWLRDPLTVRKR